ncbi:MAG: hypothetical protein KDC00_02990 [Flavobacteriales bacterium]|nr:hypothetical protein [Flavobacteriales bacterium]
MRFPVLLLIMSGGTCQAQDLLLYGRVRQYEANGPLASATTLVLRNGDPIVTIQCDSAGGYKVLLDVGHSYVLEYRSPGRVSKSILLDLRTAPDDDGGYGMNVDVRLFRPIDGVDVSFLEEPIGKAAYDSTTNDIRWDMEYTAPRIARVDQAYPIRYTVEPDPEDSIGGGPE